MPQPPIGARFPSISALGGSGLDSLLPFRIPSWSPPMTWTSDKPSSPGWYWYREPGDFNMGKPCPAWVFGSFRSMYATVIAVHSPDPAARTVTKNIKDCEGEWYGPLEVPK